MDTPEKKRAIVWGGLMILLGGLLLVEQFSDLSTWVWVAILAVLGGFSLIVALTSQTDWLLILTSYILWAIAGLIAFVSLDLLQGELPALYIMGAIALPFIAVFISDRTQWWALITPYVLMAVALMIFLVSNEILTDLMIPAYIMLAIALPFFIVFLGDFNQWWALVTAGLLSTIGIGFIFALNFVQYIGAAVLIIIGIVVLVRAILGRDETQTDTLADAPPAEEDLGE